jgi:hypothetical protein
MSLSKQDYFFYEWCILQKKITTEQASNFTCDDWAVLKKEYLNSLYGRMCSQG